jgi:hypothetical protein
MIIEVLRFAVLAGCFSSLYLLRSRIAILPEAAYRRPILAVEILRYPLKALGLFGPAAAGVIVWNQLEWHRIDPDNAVRPIVVILCVWLAWSKLRMGRNRYFRQTYIVDRIMLACLAVLSWLHPCFAMLTLSLGVLFSSQLAFPLGSPDWPVMETIRPRMQAPYYLLMFEAWVYNYLAWGSSLTDLVALFLVGFGSTYFWSAVGKLRLGWLRHNELIGVLNTAVAHSRWSNLDSRTFRLVAAMLTRFNRVLLVATIVIELGGLLLCIRWELSLGLLGCLGAFQIVVSIVSGINFKSWSIMSVLLGFMVYQIQPFRDNETSRAVASFVVILVGGSTLYPLRLAWLDTRYCNAFRLYATCWDGNRRLLHPQDFGPYEVIFDQGRLEFLTNERLLVGAWGETDDPVVAAAVRPLRSADDVHTLEDRLGTSAGDPRAAEQFDRFIRVYFDDLGKDAPVAITVTVAKCHYGEQGFQTLEEREVRSIQVWT